VQEDEEVCGWERYELYLQTLKHTYGFDETNETDNETKTKAGTTKKNKHNIPNCSRYKHIQV